MLLIAAAAVLTAWVASVEAKVYGAPDGASGAPHVVAPPVQASMPPKSPNAAAFDGLPARIEQATQDAAANGATVSVAILDRANNHLLSNGNDQLVPIASVAKLFIADEVLSQESGGVEENRRWSTADREALDSCSTGPAACLRSGRRSSSTTSPDPPQPGPMATPSGSAFPTGFTPNPLPSSRDGCAVWTAAAGCTCPRGSSAPTDVTSW
jgi:hypothetical protein